MMQRLQPIKTLAVLHLCRLHRAATRDLLATHTKPICSPYNQLTPSAVVLSSRTLASSKLVRSDKTNHQHNLRSQRSVEDTVHPSRSHRKVVSDEYAYTYRRSGKSEGGGSDLEDRHSRHTYTRYTKRPADGEYGDGNQTRRLQQQQATLDPGDVFGTLTSDSPVPLGRRDIGSKFDEEPDSDGEDDRRRPPGRRNVPYWFGKQMKKLCKEGKLKEAIEMLEIRMLKVERVHPTAYNYNILIGACGRVGYTKMAFKLYNDMKKRGILPEDATYTALINACAESPWPTTDGIERLRKLHGQLQEKGVKINLVTCHALMKAYAKCGDVQMTFNLFRHLLLSSRRVSAESFNFFLFACASDREAGLTYAIQGWRCLQQRNLKQDIFTYNLLLRVARDCGIGDLESANRVLLQRGDFQELFPPPPELNSTRNKSKKNKKDLPDVRAKYERIEILPINPVSEDNDVLSNDEDDEYGDSGTTHTYWWEEEVGQRPQANQHQTRKIDWRVSHSPAVAASTKHLADTLNVNLPDAQIPAPPLQQDTLPNLLEASSSDLQHVVSLGSMDKPQNRLALIGGSGGILEQMRMARVKPDIKTFGLLTEMIPYNTKAEKELMIAMDTAGVKGDIDFYNGLIRRRALRRDVKGAKELVSMLNTKGLYPSLKTYGNMAMGCFNSEDGLQLIEDMTGAGLKANIVVYSAMITAAKRMRDFDYMVKLLKSMEQQEILPDKKLLEKLEGIASFHQPFKDKDTESRASSKGRRWTHNNDKALNRFRQFYTLWLDRVKVAQQAHPWDNYRPEKYQPSTKKQDGMDR